MALVNIALGILIVSMGLTFLGLGDYAFVSPIVVWVFWYILEGVKIAERWREIERHEGWR